MFKSVKSGVEIFGAKLDSEHATHMLFSFFHSAPLVDAKNSVADDPGHTSRRICRGRRRVCFCFQSCGVKVVLMKLQS